MNKLTMALLMSCRGRKEETKRPTNGMDIFALMNRTPDFCSVLSRAHKGPNRRSKILPRFVRNWWVFINENFYDRDQPTGILIYWRSRRLPNIYRALRPNGFLHRRRRFCRVNCLSAIDVPPAVIQVQWRIVNRIL